MSEQSENHWHVDKRVPIALILTLAVQTLAMGIWVGSINARVDGLEEENRNSQDFQARLIRIETLQETILERLNQ